jgi:hypothetical protein
MQINRLIRSLLASLGLFGEGTGVVFWSHTHLWVLIDSDLLQYEPDVENGWAAATITSSWVSNPFRWSGQVMKSSLN